MEGVIFSSFTSLIRVLVQIQIGSLLSPSASNGRSIYHSISVHLHPPPSATERCLRVDHQSSRVVGLLNPQHSHHRRRPPQHSHRHRRRLPHSTVLSIFVQFLHLYVLVVCTCYSSVRSVVLLMLIFNLFIFRVSRKENLGLII